MVLAYRDLKVRYAQTFLGLSWALIQPLVTLLIFTLIFGRAIKVETEGIPYPVFALAGMGAWAYFSFVMSQSGGSIIAAGEMVKKIYFPRLIIPASKALVAGVDLMVTYLLLILLMFYYQVPISTNWVFLPIFLLINIVASLGVGIWLSALTIRFRDFQHVIPFLVQIGLYASPIAYPDSMITDSYQWLYHINPMAGIASGFRWAFFGTDTLNELDALSFTVSFLLFFSGVYYFKRVENVMADLV